MNNRKSFLRAVFLSAAIFFGVSPAPSPPKRILSLAPSITEILYGVGALDRVIGRTDFCDYPTEVKRIPSVGGWYNPNLEQMIALKPDLAILMKAQDVTLVNKLRELNIPVLLVPMETYAEILHGIRDIGAAVRREDPARKLVGQIEQAFAKTRKQAAESPRRRVLFVVGRKPGALQNIYVAGRDTFIDDMLRSAGGDNVVRDSIKGYATISPEAVAALDPEVILEVQESGASAKAVDPAKDWAPLKSVAAVQRGAIVPVRDEVVLRPSQRVTVAVKLLFDLLHPGSALP
ncbi:MAG: ABC transporter substrate-binding protein [bacterium]